MAQLNAAQEIQALRAATATAIATAASDIEVVADDRCNLHAYFVNSHGVKLHGYVWVNSDDITYGITGVHGPVTRPVNPNAINAPAYRSKVLTTAIYNLTELFRSGAIN